MRSFVLNHSYGVSPAELLGAMLHPGLNAFLLANIPDLKERQELGRTVTGNVVDRKTRCVPVPHLIPTVAQSVVTPAMVSWVEDARFHLEDGQVEVNITPAAFQNVFWFKGGMTLGAPSAPDSGLTQRRTEAQLEVRMFMVGRYVEDYLIAEIKRNMDAEGAALRAFVDQGLHRVESP